MVNTMLNREELKALIDRLPEKSLDQVQRILQFHLNPPAPDPQLERTRQRNMQYRQAVQERIRLLKKPGTIEIGGGSGFNSTHDGMPFSRQSFHYWEEKTLIHQSLQIFDGQEIEIVERLSFAEDREKLTCVIEITSEGRTVMHQDDFPAGGEHTSEQSMGPQLNS